MNFNEATLQAFSSICVLLHSHTIVSRKILLGLLSDYYLFLVNINVDSQQVNMSCTDLAFMVIPTVLVENLIKNVKI